MQALAQVTGDPAAIERVKDLQAELSRMRITVDETTQAIQRGFEDGLTNALEGLATRTLTIREAVEGMARDIARSLARLAAQNIANSLVTKLFGGSEKEQALITGAAAVTTSSAALASAAATMLPGAAAIEAAAISLAAANASISGAGAGGENGLIAAVASVFTGGVTAAGGGQVLGAGTPTSDSIPAWLSTTEFVTRGAVVNQPGALPFLHDFNARGMSALNDYALRVRHNTGGLAGAPAPVFSGPTRVAAPAANKAEVNNNFRFTTLFDIDDIARRVAGTDAFEKQVLNVVGDNPNAVNEMTNR